MFVYFCMDGHFKSSHQRVRLVSRGQTFARGGGARRASGHSGRVFVGGWYA